MNAYIHSGIPKNELILCKLIVGVIFILQFSFVCLRFICIQSSKTSICIIGIFHYNWSDFFALINAWTNAYVETFFYIFLFKSSHANRIVFIWPSPFPIRISASTQKPYGPKYNFTMICKLISLISKEANEDRKRLN